MSKLYDFLRLSVVVVAAALVLVFAAPASAQLLNPSFESPDASGGDVAGTANWNSFNFVFTTAAIFRTGSQSLKTFGPFSAGGGSGAVQRLPANPGETWVGEIYAQSPTFDRIDAQDFGVYKIEFLDAGGNLVAGGTFGVDVFESNQYNAASPPGWVLLGVGTAPAPAGTAFAQAVIVKVDVDGANGGSIFWDDASLMKDDPVPVEDGTWGRVKSLYR